MRQGSISQGSAFHHHRMHREIVVARIRDSVGIETTHPTHSRTHVLGSALCMSVCVASPSVYLPHTHPSNATMPSDSLVSEPVSQSVTSAWSEAWEGANRPIHGVEAGT